MGSSRRGGHFDGSVSPAFAARDGICVSCSPGGRPSAAFLGPEVCRRKVPDDRTERAGNPQTVENLSSVFAPTHAEDAGCG
jgi:hypothetical protein